MLKFGQAQPAFRSEDHRFLVGDGRFLMNREAANALHMIVVRSSHAHAEITAIDTAAAEALPGVAAVLTHGDLAAAGIGTLPCQVIMESIPGRTSFVPTFDILAHGRVRYVGQPVAAVIAETRHAAMDAAEQVAVDYRPLAAAAELRSAARDDAPRVWDENGDNIAMHWRLGDPATVEQAFAEAAHSVELALINNRISANTIEPRGALASYDAAVDKLTLRATCQNPNGLQQIMAEDVLGIPRAKLRVVAEDIGGGFGMKIFAYPEQALVLIAARQLGRSVLWLAERGEALQSDFHARDHFSEAALAFDDEGRFLALKSDTLANMGAMLSLYAMYIPTGCYVDGLPGFYRLPLVQADVRGVFTNTVPTDAYRGAGRAEGTYLCERLIDEAAWALGMDRIEIRLRNALRDHELPFANAVGQSYDSGAFARCLELAAEKSQWAGFEERRRAAAAGHACGIGVAGYVMPVGYAAGEIAQVSMDGVGNVTVALGNVSSGQSHETVVKHLIGGWLGIEPAHISVVQGDTDRVSPLGNGGGGSKFLQTAGPALQGAAERVIDKGKILAAHLLEASIGDVEFVEHRFRIVGTDRHAGWREIAQAAHAPAALPPEIEPGIDESHYFKAPANAFATGAHVAEVEVDTDTGEVEIVGYTVVNDFGVLLHRGVVEAQVHGGIAQGLGQALRELVAYDPVDGQLLSGSFLDYAMPRASDMPDMALYFEETPSTSNPLGVKGCGEAGTASAPPAIMNAIMDALRSLGVRHIDMPATPERIWRAIQDAAPAAPGN